MLAAQVVVTVSQAWTYLRAHHIVPMIHVQLFVCQTSLREVARGGESRSPGLTVMWFQVSRCEVSSGGERTLSQGILTKSSPPTTGLIKGNLPSRETASHYFSAFHVWPLGGLVQSPLQPAMDLIFCFDPTAKP